MAPGADLKVSRSGAEVEALARIGGIGPAHVLTAFTEPVLLKQWWPGDLTADLRPGGAYRVHFASLGQTMTGQVETYRPGETLVFTWGWAHELELAGRFLVAVTVSAAADGAGTVLELHHAPRPGTEIAPREGEIEGHLEGWEFFLPRLIQALAPTSD